jgi:hypothetical protein
MGVAQATKRREKVNSVETTLTLKPKQNKHIKR